MLDPSQLLLINQHRPWPLPTRPWVMTQAWHDVLFAHWPMAVAQLRALVPQALEIDTYHGQAWLGIVPFGMTRVYPRGTFPVPWLSSFLEINVRTYVRLDGKPGVYFLSLDAANRLAVEVARRWYRLPYYHAQMALRRGWRHIDYSSYRTHRGAPPAAFRARYRPKGAVAYAPAASLAAWLTERYCLYTVGRRGQVYCGEIHHAPWPLQPAMAEIHFNTMTLAYGLHLPDVEPLLHYAKRIDTLEWPITRVQ